MYWLLTCLVQGALEMRSKVVRHAMTPLQSVFMLDANEKLDRKMLRKVWQATNSWQSFVAMPMCVSLVCRF